MMPKARPPSRSYQSPESLRRFSDLSRLTREERHVLSELSTAWDSAFAKAKKKKQAELQFEAPGLLRGFPRYALDAFTFISKFSRSTQSADYGASLMEYMAGKYPQAHEQVCNMAREQLGMKAKAPSAPKEPQKPPEPQNSQDVDGLFKLYSHPETFLPVVSRARPGSILVQQVAKPGEKPWFLQPSKGVTVEKNVQFSNRHQHKFLPAPEGFTRQYHRNRLIDNLRFYMGVTRPRGFHVRAISNFVRGDRVHLRAVQLVREHGLDLAKPEHIAQLEAAISSEFGRGALGPEWPVDRSQKPEMPAGPGELAVGLKEGAGRNAQRAEKKGRQADGAALQAGVRGVESGQADPEGLLREKMARVFTRVVRYHNRTHPSGSMGWASNLIKTDPAHVKADGLLRGVAISAKMDASNPRNEPELVGLMVRHASKNPERQNEWTRLLANKRTRKD